MEVVHLLAINSLHGVLRNFDNVWPDSVKVELAGLGVEFEHIADASRLLRGIKVVQLERSTAITLLRYRPGHPVLQRPSILNGFAVRLNQ